jgi:enoyl-CoA hydratase/carnithine racemase
MKLKDIDYAVQDLVATITLSRASRRNAFTDSMNDEYRWCLAQAEADSLVRVIVVTGDPAGSAFCAGADLNGVEEIATNGEYDVKIDQELASPGYGIDDAFDANFAFHFGISKPIIAAINGPAAGLGLVLAAFCDLRYAVPGAKFTSSHGRLNFPAEYGLSWILPRLIGTTYANDILLSSRVFSSNEADRMGFLNGLVEPDDLLPHVYEYARMMARTVSPGSLRESKRQLYLDWHRSAAESVEDSLRLFKEMSGHPDCKEGVSAWMEKRPPRWRGNTE